MRSIVSGGAGFIGSHLVDVLVDRGDAVLVVDDLSSGRRSNLAGAIERGSEFVEGTLTDADFLHPVVAEFAPERIFHLAAQVDVRKAVADPAFDATVNVLGTINLLEAARRLPGTSLVFASTGGAIYGEGENRDLPFTEAAPAAPLAAYGASKLAGEVYLDLYRRLYEVPALALRFGNVYGPRQDPYGEAGVVAIFCGLLEQDHQLKIYGDGSQTRDYVFVGDVVRAIVAADEALAARGMELCGPFNVGTGTETSVTELAERLERITGRSPGADHRPDRTGEVRRVAIDPAAVEREVGWRATTDLDDGLRLTYESVVKGTRTS